MQGMQSSATEVATATAGATGARGAIEVRPVAGRAGTRDWLTVPHTVFAGDPAWVAPLHQVERERISAKHNPFFTFGEAEFFVAYRDGQPVGRISAQVNRNHLARYHDATGHFGFFDCVEDQAVARALVDAASRWLAARGMTRMLGPMHLSINEDIGLLVDGFDTPPFILSSHARPWQGALLERCGLTKAMDLYAYRMDPTTVPAQVLRLAQLARESGRIKVRTFDMARYAQELDLVFDIFNDAWSDNWGFVPFSPAEIKALIKSTKPIMRGEYGRIAEIDGKPAAMMVGLVDINAVIGPYNGRLLPFNWAKLALSLYRNQVKAARIPLLGVRKEFRNTHLAPAVLSLLVAEFIDVGRFYGLNRVEFSWVLEHNRAMTKLAELAAGPPYKTYRLYETAI